MLSAYFQPHESDEVKAGQVAWWCDELQDWTHEQIVWALRKWNRDNPRLRPTPGDIVGICAKARGERIAARMRAEAAARKEPERKPVDAETAARIMAEAGFTPKRM